MEHCVTSEYTHGYVLYIVLMLYLIPSKIKLTESL